MKAIFFLLVLATLLCATGCSHKITMKDCEQVWTVNQDTKQPEATNKSWCSPQYEIWN